MMLLLQLLNLIKICPHLLKESNMPSTVKAAQLAYKEAGTTDPRKQIDAVEVHDCFTITELINTQDVQFCDREVSI